MRKQIKKVFINAPIFDVEKNNQEIFTQLSSEIWRHNVEAVAPSLEVDEEIPDAERLHYIRKLAAVMVQCDLVVTHGNWFSFIECNTLNLIARTLSIEVVHYSRMNERLSKNTNKSEI